MLDAVRPLLSAGTWPRGGANERLVQLSGMLLSLAGRPLDLLYSRLGGLNGPFFRDGWGNLGIVDLQQDVEIVSQWPPSDLQV